MNWKFWQKSATDSPAGGNSLPRLPKPKDLPQELGRHLVVAAGHEPDWVWALKCVFMPRDGQKPKGLCDLRIFHPEEVAREGVSVRDYASLDAHPQLILFEGWMDQTSRQFQIQFLRKAG